jgi:hypothetical protein
MTQSAGIESNNIITKIMLNMILGSNMAMLDFFMIVYHCIFESECTYLVLLFVLVYLLHELSI